MIKYFVGLKSALVLLLLLTLSIPCLPAEASRVAARTNGESKIHPALLYLGHDEPDQSVRVIALGSGPISAVSQYVAHIGGEVVRELGLVNGLVIDIRAKDILALADSHLVSRISPDAPVRKTADFGADQLVLVEGFSSEPAPDSVNWNWFEVGEEDGFGAGEIATTLFLGGTVEGLRMQSAGKGIQTNVDLDLAGSVMLSLAFRRKGFESTSDAMRIEVSQNGGDTWHLIERLAGPNSDALLQVGHYDVSAYAAPQTSIRIIAEEGLSDRARFYIDYVQLKLEIDQTYRANSLMLPLLSGSEPEFGVSAATAGTFVRDEFNSISYHNNDGNLNWESGWTEVGDDGSPSAGDITIEFVGCPGSNSRCIEYDGDTNTNAFLYRWVDLSGAETALLTFDYHLDSSDAVYHLDVSTNGGASWTNVREYGIQGTVLNESVDLSPYISSDTYIRFRLDKQDVTSHYYIDNVQIESGCATCIDTANLASTYPRAISADRLWNRQPQRQGDSVTIAVLDSGIADHPDLMSGSGSRVIRRVDFTDGGIVDDFYGHGTHVAGAIAGNGTKSDGGYIGIAPRATLIDVKVTDDFGVGTTSNVVEGLEWVLEHKDEYNIRVVNMSLNSTVAESYHDSPLDLAVEILWFNGITVVVSSGNNGDNVDAGILYAPANDPFVITVGAMNDMGTVDREDDQLASFTAYGVTPDGFQKPEIFAPGKDIIAPLAADDANLALAHPSHAIQGPDGSYYFRMSGTSMASAIAAGAIALLIEDRPHLTPDQVKFQLMETGTPFLTGAYVDIKEALDGEPARLANQGVVPHMVLARMALIAYWASQNGGDNIDWSSVNWNSVNWNSVNWNSVDWNSVNWNSVNWNSVNWNSVDWSSVNWQAVNWNSVNWNSGFTWSSVSWNSSFTWSSVNWNSTYWDD